MGDATDQPLVSILIPTYNRSGYLREALESAQAQTYAPIEIVVVDDASPDDTEAVVRSVEDDRVRYLRNPTNLGVVGNWQKAITCARGDYYCILGDDDVLEPTFVERLVAPMACHPAAALAFSDHGVMDAESLRLHDAADDAADEWGRKMLKEGLVEDFAETILIDRSAFITGVLFKREAFDPATMTDEARGFIDYWMFYQAFRGGGQAYYVPERLVQCRWQLGGVSRNLNWRRYMMQGEIFCYRQMLHDVALHRYEGVLRTRMAISLSSCGNSLVAVGERRQGRAMLAESLAMGASNKAVIGYALSFFGPLGSWLAASIQQHLAKRQARNAS